MMTDKLLLATFFLISVTYGFQIVSNIFFPRIFRLSSTKQYSSSADFRKNVDLYKTSGEEDCSFGKRRKLVKPEILSPAGLITIAFIVYLIINFIIINSIVVIIVINRHYHHHHQQ